MSNRDDNIQLSILVIDDDPHILQSIEDYLKARGHRVCLADGGTKGIEVLRREAVDIVITDIKMPDMDGFQVLQEVRRLSPDTEVIMITGYGEIEAAVRSMREGAFDFFTKPLAVHDLAAALQRTVRFQGLRREKDRYRQRLDSLGVVGRQRFGLSAIIGESRAMKEVRSLIEEACRADSISVLILGETGTGKELVAQAIHYESGRSGGPFLGVDCSSIPESLVESEFYGHVKGAFTDAREDRKGHFELADGGTLFLDEVGDMAPAMQARLLRTLEQRRVRPVGGSREFPVDLRVVSATNQNLPEAIAAGRFRNDLYYRLNAFTIEIPPLRERREDILPLAEFFLRRYRQELHKEVQRFSPEAVSLLESYDFPGNVREMRNMVERATILCKAVEVGTEHLRFEPSATPNPAEVSGPDTTPPPDLPRFLSAAGAEDLDLTRIEAAGVREALRRCGGNQVAAAELLGISRTALRRRIERHRIGSRKSKD